MSRGWGGVGSGELAHASAKTVGRVQGKRRVSKARCCHPFPFFRHNAPLALSLFILSWKPPYLRLTSAPEKASSFVRLCRRRRLRRRRCGVLSLHRRFWFSLPSQFVNHHRVSERYCIGNSTAKRHCSNDQSHFRIKRTRNNHQQSP